MSSCCAALPRCPNAGGRAIRIQRRQQQSKGQVKALSGNGRKRLGGRVVYPRPGPAGETLGCAGGRATIDGRIRAMTLRYRAWLLFVAVGALAATISPATQSDRPAAPT